MKLCTGLRQHDMMQMVVIIDIVTNQCVHSFCTAPPPNFCVGSPCQNGGTCSSQSSTYSCSCPAGFNGRNCENGTYQHPYLLGPKGSSSCLFLLQLSRFCHDQSSWLDHPLSLPLSSNLSTSPAMPTAIPSQPSPGLRTVRRLQCRTVQSSQSQR